MKREAGYVTPYIAFSVFMVLFISMYLFNFYIVEINKVNTEQGRVVKEIIAGIDYDKTNNRWVYKKYNGEIISVVLSNKNTLAEAIEEDVTSPTNSLLKSEIQERIKQRFLTLGSSVGTGKLSLFRYFTVKEKYEATGSDELGGADTEASVKVPSLAIYEEVITNSDGVELGRYIRGSIRTQLRCSFPRILLLGKAKGDTFTSTSNIKKTRIFITNDEPISL